MRSCAISMGRSCWRAMCSTGACRRSSARPARSAMRAAPACPPRLPLQLTPDRSDPNDAGQACVHQRVMTPLQEENYWAGALLGMGATAVSEVGSQEG